MTTSQTARNAQPARKKKPSGQIPFIQYLRFRNAKTREGVERLNDEFVVREIEKEKQHVTDLAKAGDITKENGAEAFVDMCKRRLSGASWKRTREHSVQVRDVAFKIAVNNEERRRSIGKKHEKAGIRLIATVAGYHDIGKTLIAPYLINREDGTVFGIGRGSRINFETELPVLRETHVTAGMKLLRLYRDFIQEDDFELMRLIVLGHHVAYNGIGTASAPSYPEKIGNMKVSGLITIQDGKVRNNQLPSILKIIRAADVYCATLENRFYLNESERFVNMAKAEGIEAEDAAVALLIAVAGIDVDPGMVACLMTARYETDFDYANEIIGRFSCNDPKSLRKKGKDIEWALNEIIKRKRFRLLCSRKKESWKKKMNTGLFLLADVFSDS